MTTILGPHRESPLPKYDRTRRQSITSQRRYIIVSFSQTALSLTLPSFSPLVLLMLLNNTTSLQLFFFRFFEFSFMILCSVNMTVFVTCPPPSKIVLFAHCCWDCWKESTRGTLQCNIVIFCGIVNALSGVIPCITFMLQKSNFEVWVVLKLNRELIWQ